jgi:nucleoside 2-deoxyribosyltransferase
VSIRVYLAGPDVFLPDPEGWAARKKAICAAHGLIGVSPLDDFPDPPAEWAAFPLWRQLAIRNEARIRSCQAIIANLTPFRGPSADVGTVYEVGFGRALGLAVFGYATTATPFFERTRASNPATERDGAWWDADGLLLEQFGLFDNLMIEGGITGSGGALTVADAADPWHDLTVFERCVTAAAAALRPAAP